MPRYGYIRKRQVVSLMGQVKALAPYDCQQVFIEKESVKETKELEKCITLLKPRDTLIIDSVLSFGQPLGSNPLSQLSQLIISQNVRLICLAEGLDTAKAPLFVEVMNAINKREHCLVKRRYKELSGTNGLTGRPKIKEAVSEQIWQLYVQKKTIREIAEICGVSIGTVHKYVSKRKKWE